MIPLHFFLKNNLDVPCALGLLTEEELKNPGKSGKPRRFNIREGRTLETINSFGVEYRTGHWLYLKTKKR